MPTLDVQSLRRVVFIPAGALPVLFVVLGGLGMLWAYGRNVSTIELCPSSPMTAPQHSTKLGILHLSGARRSELAAFDF